MEQRPLDGTDLRDQNVSIHGFDLGTIAHDQGRKADRARRFKQQPFPSVPGQSLNQQLKQYRWSLLRRISLSQVVSLMLSLREYRLHSEY